MRRSNSQRSHGWRISGNCERPNDRALGYAIDGCGYDNTGTDDNHHTAEHDHHAFVDDHHHSNDDHHHHHSNDDTAVDNNGNSAVDNHDNNHCRHHAGRSGEVDVQLLFGNPGEVFRVRTDRDRRLRRER